MNVKDRVVSESCIVSQTLLDSDWNETVESVDNILDWAVSQLSSENRRLSQA